MKNILILLFVPLLLLSCGKKQQSKKHSAVNEKKCRAILKSFFTEYDKAIKSKDIKKLADYLDKDFIKYGQNKKETLERVDTNFLVISQYEVTVERCSIKDENTIIWQGEANYGSGITKYNPGSMLKRRNGKWRLLVIEKDEE